MTKLLTYVADLIQDHHTFTANHFYRPMSEKIYLSNPNAIAWPEAQNDSHMLFCQREFDRLMSLDMSGWAQPTAVQDLSRGYFLHQVMNKAFKYQPLLDTDDNFVVFVSSATDWMVARPDSWEEFSRFHGCERPLKSTLSASSHRVFIMCHEVGHALDPRRQEALTEFEPAWSESFADCFGVLAAIQYCQDTEILPQILTARKMQLLAGGTGTYATMGALTALEEAYENGDVPSHLSGTEMVALATKICEKGLASDAQPAMQAISTWKMKMSQTVWEQEKQGYCSVERLLPKIRQLLKEDPSVQSTYQPLVDHFYDVTEDCPSHVKARSAMVLGSYRQKIATLLSDPDISERDKRIALVAEKAEWQRQKEHVPTYQKMVAKTYRHVAPLLEKELSQAIKGLSLSFPEKPQPVLIELSKTGQRDLYAPELSAYAVLPQSTRPVKKSIMHRFRSL